MENPANLPLSILNRINRLIAVLSENDTDHLVEFVTNLLRLQQRVQSITSIANTLSTAAPTQGDRRLLVRIDKYMRKILPPSVPMDSNIYTQLIKSGSMTSPLSLLSDNAAPLHDRRSAILQESLAAIFSRDNLPHISETRHLPQREKSVTFNLSNRDMCVATDAQLVQTASSVVMNEDKRTAARERVLHTMVRSLLHENDNIRRFLSVLLGIDGADELGVMMESVAYPNTVSGDLLTAYLAPQDASQIGVKAPRYSPIVDHFISTCCRHCCAHDTSVSTLDLEADLLDHTSAHYAYFSNILNKALIPGFEQPNFSLGRNQKNPLPCQKSSCRTTDLTLSRASECPPKEHIAKAPSSDCSTPGFPKCILSTFERLLMLRIIITSIYISYGFSCPFCNARTEATWTKAEAATDTLPTPKTSAAGDTRNERDEDYYVKNEGADQFVDFLVNEIDMELSRQENSITTSYRDSTEECKTFPIAESDEEEIIQICPNSTLPVQQCSVSAVTTQNAASAADISSVMQQGTSQKFRLGTAQISDKCDQNVRTPLLEQDNKPVDSIISKELEGLGDGPVYLQEFTALKTTRYRFPKPSHETIIPCDHQDATTSVLAAKQAIDENQQEHSEEKVLLIRAKNVQNSIVLNHFDTLTKTEVRKQRSDPTHFSSKKYIAMASSDAHMQSTSATRDEILPPGSALQEASKDERPQDSTLVRKQQAYVKLQQIYSPRDKSNTSQVTTVSRIINSDVLLNAHPEVALSNSLNITDLLSSQGNTSSNIPKKKASQREQSFSQQHVQNVVGPLLCQKAKTTTPEQRQLTPAASSRTPLARKRITKVEGNITSFQIKHSPNSVKTLKPNYPDSVYTRLLQKRQIKGKPRNSEQ